MAAILKLRRGTSYTSLQESELFYNTSLETIVIGDGSGSNTSSKILVKLNESNSGSLHLLGDITGSNIYVSGDITASNLSLSGDADIIGNITLGGDIFLGDGTNATDNINVNASFSGSLIPTTTSVFSLGTNTKKYLDLRVVNATIDNINLPGSTILSSSATNFTDYSQSVDNRLDVEEAKSVTLETVTSSLDTRLDVEEAKSATLSPLTASYDSRLSNLQITSASHDNRLDVEEAKSVTLETVTSSLDQRADRLEAYTSSFASDTVTLTNKTINGANNTLTVDISRDTNLAVSDTTEVNMILTNDTISAELIGGVVSGSSQVSYVGLSNIPSGIVSGSSQITTLGFLENIVEDTTPQLGGNLDLNSNNINGSGIINATTIYNNESSGSGIERTFFGYNAGAGSSGERNSAFGSDALSSGSSGTRNSAFGEGALHYTTTGENNVAVGSSALRYNEIGIRNTAVGQSSLIGQFNNPTSNFNNNTAIGNWAGRNHTDNSGTNVLDTSVGSIFIGAGAHAKQNNSIEEIVIGSGSIGHGSNTTTIGNTNTSDSYIYGDLNIFGNISGSSFNGTGLLSGSVTDQLPSGTVSGSSQINSLIVGTSYSQSVDTRLDSLEVDTHTHSNKANLDTINQNLSTNSDVTFNTGSFTGNMTINGNLTVLGSATEIQTTELRIEDKLITVASGSVDSAAADGAGIEIDGAGVSIQWDHNTTSFVLNAKVSSSVGFKGEGGELTGIDTDQVTEGSNLYYTNTRVKTKLNTDGVISGSSQLTSDLDLRYESIGNGIVSSSSQIDADQTTGWVADVRTQIDNVGLVSSSAQINANSITNFDSNVEDKLNAENVHSGSYLGTSTTTHLSEGTNLYWTENRFSSSLDNRGVISGSAQVDYDSIQNQPTTITGGQASAITANTSKVGYTDALVKAKLDVETVISGSTFQSNHQGSFTSSINGVATNVDLGLNTNDSPTFNTITLSSVAAGGSSDYDAIFDVSGLLKKRTIGTAAFLNVSSSIADDPNSVPTTKAVNDALITAGAGDITEVNPTSTFQPATTGLIHGTTGTNVGGVYGVQGNIHISVATGSAHFTGGVKQKLDADGVISGSSQLYTDLDSRYNNELGEGVVSGSSQVVLNDADKTGFDTADVSEGTNLYYTDVRVKTKLDADGVISGSVQILGGSGVISGSSQIDHDTTTNFVANEHIDHSSITVGSGKGLSGGGTIDTNRSLSLDTGSVHFQEGVELVLPAGTVSGSSQIVLNNSDKTGFDTTDVSEGTNLYYTDTRVKIKLDTDGVISGSSQFDNSSISNESLNTYTGSAITAAAIQDSRLDQLSTETGSISTEQGVQDQRLTAIESVSGSFLTELIGGILSSSNENFNTFSQSLDNRLDTLEGDVHENVLTFGDTANIDLIRTTNNITANIKGGIFSGSAQVDVASTTNYSSINQYSDSKVKTKLNADGVISGSVQILGGSGLVSGSSQIDVAQTTNYGTISTHIASTANPHSVTATQVNLGNVTNESKATMFTSPTFTGTPLSTTPSSNDSSTKIATTAYVQGEITDLIGGAGAAFDTLLEISASIANGDSDVVALTTTVSGKLTKADNLSDLTNAGTARTNLGVAIGTDVQAYNSTLAAVAGSTYSGDNAITTLGTIATGTWNGSVIASAYLDADTAHLSGTQTFTGAKTFSNATNSTSKTTGAVIVTGGVGIGGTLNVGGDVVAYASSDRELKNNILPITNPLEKINSIGGYSFEWNTEKQHIYKGKDYGVIAQEIELVLPELVQTRENGYKAVRYDKIVSLLIEGIKELSNEVEELKRKIQS